MILADDRRVDFDTTAWVALINALEALLLACAARGVPLPETETVELLAALNRMRGTLQ